MDDLDHLNAYARCGCCARVIADTEDFCDRCLHVTAAADEPTAVPQRLQVAS